MSSKKPEPIIVQPPPPTVTQLPPVDVAKASQQGFESQLQYNPQLTEQEYQLQAKYGPLYRALFEQMFPSQTRGLESLAEQAYQRLQSNFNLTPEQQAATDAIRNREQERFLRGIRTQANLGGTLYSGAREQQEQEGLAELARQYSLQDIGLQQQNREQTLRELIAAGQVAFPQVQQFTQGVTPSPDALLAAIQGSQFVQPAAIGFPQGGRGFNWGQAAGAAAGAKLAFRCLPGTSLIDTAQGPKHMDKIEVGERLSDGQIVLMQYSYIAFPTPFVRITFMDGTEIETCDRHVIDGKEAQAYQVGDVLQGRTIISRVIEERMERTYDLLTDAPDGGYESSGVHIPSMIPTLHKTALMLSGA